MADAVSHILTRLRVPLLVLLAAVAIVLIATVVVTGRRRALLESSTVLIEEIEQRWLTVASESERASMARCSRSLSCWPSATAVATRSGALQLLALRHAEREEWQEAADRFSELAEVSTGYLAALALRNCGRVRGAGGPRDCREHL
ncbi:hypothetical protein GBAR_LOCUS21259 [Geodia barretti]|uniref:Uncharacterized protein n=1 Tax=Geodia barretti TaxID=519541 RepID=A0AA35SXV3_GEOBA|nr:hypothetical protein GBAR_LOCUS21259 [Geodia barretti]